MYRGVDWDKPHPEYDTALQTSDRLKQEEQAKRKVYADAFWDYWRAQGVPCGNNNDKFVLPAIGPVTVSQGNEDARSLYWAKRDEIEREYESGNHTGQLDGAESPQVIRRKKIEALSREYHDEVSKAPSGRSPKVT